jgi:hypothetical protein
VKSETSWKRTEVKNALAFRQERELAKKYWLRRGQKHKDETKNKKIPYPEIIEREPSQV